MIKLLMTGQHTATSCCESGRPIMTDPHTGQTVCSCQYDTRLLSYPRLASGLPVSMYSSAYADQSYVPFGADPSAFYSPLDNADAWRGIPQPTACYPYDPTMTGYPYGDRYGGVDLNGSARRKNATRETTSTLKAWLYEHRKNPYPTKGEKIMLAIITKMTLTQVSTWFANARRRLKKENKMTWSPRNRCGDERDKLESDMEDSDSQNNDNSTVNQDNSHIDGSDNDTNADETQHSDKTQDSDLHKNDESQSSSVDLSGSQHSPLPPHPLNIQSATSVDLSVASSAAAASSLCKSDSLNSNGNSQVNTTKPRIWSLAHTATSRDSPPLNRRPSSPNHGTKTFVTKAGQNLCSPMSTLRNWVDGVFHGPTSLSHAGVVQYPGLNVISSHALANTNPATSTSNSTHLVQQTATSISNPIRLGTTTTMAACYPSGQSAPLLPTQALLHPVLNGGLDRSQVKKKELLDQKVNLGKDDLEDNSSTAFKPVTKSKYNELMMA